MRRVLCFTFLNPVEMEPFGLALAQALRLHGTDIQFASPFSLPGLVDNSIKIQLLLKPYHSFSGPGAGLESLPANCVQEAILADQAFHETAAGSVAEHTSGLAGAHHYFRQLLKALAPSLVLVWGSSLPHNLLLAALARQMNIELQELERGLFPGTFMVKPFPWPNVACIYDAPWSKDPLSDNPSDFEIIRSHYLKIRPEKYPQGRFIRGAEYREAMQLQHKKVFCFVSHNDIYAGVLPRARMLSRIVSPYFASVREALAHVMARLRSMPNAVLIFKPHPMDHKDYSMLDDSQLIIDSNVHLHTLCDAADVIIVDSTSAQYEALFFEKPMILLGNSYLLGQGIGWPVSAPDAFADVHDFVDQEARKAKARQFVLTSFQRALYVPDPKLPFGKKIDELAEDLIRLMQKEQDC